MSSYKLKIKEFLLKYRRAIVIFINLGLITLSYFASFALHFDFSLPQAYTPIFLKTLPVLLAIKFFTFYYFGVFHGLWRYVSMNDLWQILKANAAATGIFICSKVFIFGTHDFPRSIFLNDFLLCTISVAGIRFFVRLIREGYHISPAEKRKRILIVGAGDAGILALKECRRNPALGEVVGFIDDDSTKYNATIHGVKILGKKEEISAIANKYSIEEIILAIPSAKGEVIRNIILNCQIPGTKLKIIPGINKILKGEVEIKTRNVQPEDLLGRETVNISKTEVSAYIKEKVVLVTGAGGSIGSALCRQIVRFLPHKIIFFDHNENNIYFLDIEFRAKYPNIKFRSIVGDIKDIGLLKQVFSKYSPQVIFHAAAHKHVPLMEDNPAAAVKNNIIGTRNLIYAAEHYKAERFVLISTDKAVRPSSIMGTTKRIAEMILQAKAQRSKTKFIAVRFGNVLGSDGSVIPLFKKQIEEGGPITITHPEVKRYFMSANEAAQLVLQAGAFGQKGEIFMLDMGEQIKILDLAKNLIILSGLTPDKDISIKFIGLRPGEKLAEEMFLEVEKSQATKHNKIHILPPKSLNIHRLRSQIRELEQLSQEMREDEIIQKIRTLISE